jgi:hypothetical protein
MQSPILSETGSRRQFHRPIPPRLAAIVEYLELFQPRILTLSDLGGYLRELGMDDAPATVARDLQKHGWLLPLRTRGRWEFAPGARAGALPSGDPFIELRATLQRRELPVALAYDSAAWLQGLSARQPQTQVLATYPKRKLPLALSDFRITRIWGVLEPEWKDNLPVWRVATLLAKMAVVPHYYRDWPNVAEWLEEGFKRADAADLERELDCAPDPARIRLAYLADRANFKHLAQDLMQRARRDIGLVYLGRDRARSRFIKEYNLIDSLLVPSVKA